jgi:WhiB family transcriptional regulator, redox-sensing transcriptional regulator
MDSSTHLSSTLNSSHLGSTLELGFGLFDRNSEATTPEVLTPTPQQPNTTLSLNNVAGSSRLGRWNDGTWRLDAACDGMDTLIFFPIGETGPAAPQVKLAKTICASCPVREECLEFAIATIQNDGIWGGTTEDERRLIKRARRAAARKAAARAAAASAA